jgi:hypothetical protein
MSNEEKTHLVVKRLIEKRALAVRTNKIANHEPSGKKTRGVPLNCLCSRNNPSTSLDPNKNKLV